MTPQTEWLMHAQAAGFTTPDPSFDRLVIRREHSLLAADVEAAGPALADAFAGKSILIAGGGGSIGAATTAQLLAYRPRAVHVVDHSENYLVELVRDLRARPEGLSDIDFRTFPVDYCGAVMERLLREAARYDVVLNFAALKHVRSEKDLYSLLQMIDTNVVGHQRFKRWLSRNGHARVYFSVSTDKAANPTSLMGATKRLMEDVIFDVAAGDADRTASARFANVAFSNGSLLDGFLHRLARRQPLAVPRDTHRYFVSRREAGELCLMAASAIPDRHIAFPRLDPTAELQELVDIAERLLKALGFRAEFFDDECEARNRVGELVSRGRWPILLTCLDTSGEKPFEEFVGDGEVERDLGLNAISTLRHEPSGALESGLIDRLATLIRDVAADSSKAEIVEIIMQSLTSFRHVETGRNLDQRF